MSGWAKHGDKWHQLAETQTPPTAEQLETFTTSQRVRSSDLALTKCCGARVFAGGDPETGLPWEAPIDSSPVCAGSAPSPIDAAADDEQVPAKTKKAKKNA